MTNSYLRAEKTLTAADSPFAASGPPPAATRRLQCEQVGVLNIDRKRDGVTIKFTEQAQIDPEKLARFVAQTKGAQFSPGGVLKFSLTSIQPRAVMEQVGELLRGLS